MGKDEKKRVSLKKKLSDSERKFSALINTETWSYTILIEWVAEGVASKPHDFSLHTLLQPGRPSRFSLSCLGSSL